MTCPPFCDRCGGNLGHPSNGDDTCDKCKRLEALRKGPKRRIRADQFDSRNPDHFALKGPTGRGWRYYRKGT